MVEALEMQEDGTTLDIDLTKESLESHKVFCVVDNTNKNVYIWLGKEANVRKRFVGARTAGKIRGELSTGFRVRSLDQGDESPAFFNSLKRDQFPARSVTFYNPPNIKHLEVTSLRGLMKTARGVGNLELREIDDPKPKRDEVLIEVAAAGICGTDIHIKHDQAFYTPPVVLGHEYSGRVIEVGEDVTSVTVGDSVVSPATAYCGKCHQCKTGHMNRCTATDKRILGTSHANGAFAKYLVVPDYIVHQVPKDVSMEEAALAEPFTCVSITIPTGNG